jgi:SulP family sulfate permease
MTRTTPRAQRRRVVPGVGDILAGVTVAMVVIPQSLAYAELAGMPAYTGLYATVAPAIAAAFFVSSPYLQTGPSAMTALLTFGALSQLAPPGSSAYIGLAMLLALIVGLVRLCIGWGKFGSVAYLISQPVLIGFTSAAAILILSSQLPTIFGVLTPSHGVLPRAFWTLTHLHVWELTSVGLSVMTVAIILFGRRLHPLFPGVLLAVGLGIGFSHLTGYEGAVIGSIPAGLPRLHLALPWTAVPTLIISGGVIALVGFVETASICRTYATQDRMKWDANQEFISQGAANVAAGLFGGFPVGGSFGRSAINRLAGAKSRWSGAVTGLVVLTFLPFTAVLSALPKAILGAIVMTAVANLIRPQQLLELWRYSHPQASIALLTFGLTLVLAPRIDIAILIGIGLAVAQHLRREQQLVFQHWLDADAQVLHFRPLGVLWFGSASTLEATFIALLAEYPSVQEAIVHLGGLGRIDLSGAMILKQLMDDAKQAGIEIELLEVPPMAKSWVARVWYDS